MPAQSIKPIEDGVELEIEQDDGTTYTIRFHCPPDGEMDIRARPNGDLEIDVMDSDGNKKEWRPGKGNALGRD